MNNAIKISHGDIIVPLSSDDQFANNNVFSVIAEIFNTTGCKVLTYSRMKYDENMDKSICIIPSKASISYINKHMNTPYEQYIHMSRGQAMDFASGAALCYTRKFFFDIGMYDTAYRLWEDGPFIAKVVRNNYKIERRYDCEFIKYRDGGISSTNKKKNVNSIYLNDISIFYRREFIEYPDKIKGINKIIPKGLYAYYSKNNRIIIQNLFCVIVCIIHRCYVKFQKQIFYNKKI